MPPCRPLKIEECAAMYSAYTGRHKLRNQCLHLLCLTTGLRIHEALSIRVSDVLQNRQVVQALQVQRGKMKQAAQGRTILLPAQTREAIRLQLDWLLKYGHLGPDQFLFRSQLGDRPMRVAEAWKIFNDAANKAGLRRDLGTLATHSWRKTFATEIFCAAVDRVQAGERIDPMREVARALGHADMKNTEKYLPVDPEVAFKNMQMLEARHSYALP